MSSEKILYKAEGYNILEKEGSIGVRPMLTSVIIMPFTCDENKLPLLIGVVQGPNPFREGGMDVSLATGDSNEEDPDLFSTAKRSLKDCSGINVEESSKWYYLGTSTTSKFVDAEYPCFAVDVTGMDKEIDKEKKFKFIPANDVVKTKDIFIPGLFLKLFKYVMGMNISNPDQPGGKNKVHSLNL